MVRPSINIQRLVIWLVVGLVFSWRDVEGNVKKIHLNKAWFNGKLQLWFLKTLITFFRIRSASGPGMFVLESQPLCYFAPLYALTPSPCSWCRVQICNYSLRSFSTSGVSLQTVCLEGIAAKFLASALYAALYAYFSFSLSLFTLHLMST